MQGAQTRLSLSDDQALVLELMRAFSTASRRVYQRVNTGLATLEEAMTELGQEHALTSHQRKSVRFRVEQWQKTDREALVWRLQQKRLRVVALRSVVDDLQVQLQRAETSLHATPRRLASLRSAVFQKKRTLGAALRALEIMEADLKVSHFHRVFGGKKRLQQRNRLHENGSPYADLAHWQREWTQARESEVWLLGDGSRTGSNQSAQLDLDDRTLTLRLTEPQAQARLQTEAKRLGVPMEKVPGKLRFKRLTVHDVRFAPRMEADLRQAQALGLPITVSLNLKPSPKGRDDLGCYLHASYTLPKPPLVTSHHQGVLGVDLNAGGLSWCIATPEGNVMKASTEGHGGTGQALKGTLQLKLRHRSADQAQAAVQAAVNTLVGLAETYGVAIAYEDLDFSKAKAGLREQAPGYARMLSTLRTAGFADALASRCRKRGLPLHKVDPSWTSVAGFAKYGLRNALSIDQAAAFAIARKALLGRHGTDRPVPTHSQASGKKFSPAFVRKLQTQREAYTVRFEESVRFAQPLPLPIQRILSGHKPLAWRHVRKVLGPDRKDWVRRLTQSPVEGLKADPFPAKPSRPRPQRAPSGASGSRKGPRETSSASRLLVVPKATLRSSTRDLNG